jgi:hypothetical protein
MFRKSTWVSRWLLILILSAFAGSTMTGCFFDDHGHDHHDEHHDWDHR